MSIKICKECGTEIHECWPKCPVCIDEAAHRAVMERNRVIQEKRPKSVIAPSGLEFVKEPRSLFRTLLEFYAWALASLFAIYVGAVVPDRAWIVPSLIFGGLFLCCLILMSSTLFIVKRYERNKH